MLIALARSANSARPADHFRTVDETRMRILNLVRARPRGIFVRAPGRRVSAAAAGASEEDGQHDDADPHRRRHDRGHDDGDVLAAEPGGCRVAHQLQVVVTRQRPFRRLLHPREALGLVDLELRHAFFVLLPDAPRGRHAVEEHLGRTALSRVGADVDDLSDHDRPVRFIGVFDLDRHVGEGAHRRRGRRGRRTPVLGCIRHRRSCRPRSR